MRSLSQQKWAHRLYPDKAEECKNTNANRAERPFQFFQPVQDTVNLPAPPCRARVMRTLGLRFHFYYFFQHRLPWLFP